MRKPIFGLMLPCLSILSLIIACDCGIDDSPFIYTEERVNTAQENIDKYPWARVVFDSLKEVADDAASIDVAQIPQWISEYTPTRVVDCPVCGTFWAEYIWKWNRDDPDAILCRVCSTRVTSAKYPDNDSALVFDPQGAEHYLPVHRHENDQMYQFQERIAYEKLIQVQNWLEALAGVYAITGDETYARTILRFLDRLADVYPGYALHDWNQYGTKPWNRAGKISGWNYQDAILIVACGRAFDAIEDSPAWKEFDRKKIVDGIFQSAADFLTAIRPDKQIVNDAPFRYAGVAMAGRILRDAEVMRWVLDEELGIVPFMLRHWHYDGSWVERSPSYHLMALRKFHEVVDILDGYTDPSDYLKPDRIENFRLQDMQLLRKMYESLFRITYPDGTLPPINDSHVGDKPPPLLAEAALAWFDSNEALLYLASALNDSTLNRGDVYSLFHRPPDAPQKLHQILTTESIERKSQNVDDLGLAIIRNDSSEHETMLTVKYGGIHGGHDHMDKLDLTLFAHGREMLSDLGYVYSMHKDIFTWTQRTLAHNTVTVDGINQRLMGGSCDLFHDAPGFKVIETQGPWIYHTVTDVFNRQIIFVERGLGRYFIDVFRVSGGTMHDWSVHAESPKLSIDGIQFRNIAALSGRDYAYDHLKRIRKGALRRNNRIIWQWDEPPRARLKLNLLSPHGAEVYLADAPAQRKIGQEGRTLPYLIIRTKDRSQSTFIAAWEPFNNKEAVRSVKLLDMKKVSKTSWPVILRIQWSDGVEDIIACDLTDTPNITTKIGRGIHHWQGRVELVRRQNDTIIKHHQVKAFSH